MLKLNEKPSCATHAAAAALGQKTRKIKTQHTRHT